MPSKRRNPSQRESDQARHMRLLREAIAQADAGLGRSIREIVADIRKSRPRKPRKRR